MASLYTNFDGDDLDAFNHFLKAEGLKPSAGLLRIFREWRRLVASAGPLPRYSSLSPEQLNLILGAAAEIKRGLKRCELALLEPRPLLPDELAEWKLQQEAAQATFQRINRWQDELTRTGVVIATPPVDIENARRFALFSYAWKGDRVGAYQKLLFSLLSLFIKIPERPVRPPEQSAMPPVAPVQPAPKS